MRATATLGLLAATLVVFGAGSGCREPRESDGLAQRWLDAMNAHDPARVLALLAPDADYTDPGTKVPLAPPELAEKLTKDWALWKDQVFTATRVHEAPNSSVVEWRVQQTHPGGKHFDFAGVTVLETDGIAIRALRTYYNPVMFLQFLPKEQPTP